ncbi:DegT/DnrJ/EryC1/StrS family aminotransferase [Acidovorax sp. DW039]|uniref:DegT/DnrJ/EryC1/StrS family aminotransferase n=1 Tax=Acidovorax sp. DW039 TaxID=3095606 RepID=UPI00308D87ED|nr:DegT/DnrJ/EryC1/StrS family aminotransferase [Acidovorax sp. DW039]
MGREVPPTAGLPLEIADLWPRRGQDFSSALSSFLGLPEMQLECSGTAALVIALTTLARHSPDRTEVIVPAYTCPLVALAVAHSGLQLRLCDLSPDSLDLDPTHLQRLCSSKTLAVLPTHLGGRVVGVAAVHAAARAVGAWVIEDAAQALGARIHSASVGAQSDMVFFSLAVGKGLSIYEGGALSVADPSLRKECQQTAKTLAPFKLVWELRRSFELLAYSLVYRPTMLPWVYGAPLRKALAQGDPITAAGDDFSPSIPLHRVGRWRNSVGARALARLPAWLDEGRTRAMERLVRLSRIPAVKVVQDSTHVAYAAGTWPIIMILLPNSSFRDQVLRQLWGAGLGVSLPFAHALPDYPCYAEQVPHAGPDELPNARSFAARVIAISNSPWLSNTDFERICATIENTV